MATINFSYLENLSDGDKDFVVQFIQTFEANSTKIIGKMKKQYLAQEWEELDKSIHQLKPSIVILELDGLDTLLEIQHAPNTTTPEKLAFIETNCREALISLKKWASDFR